MYYGLMDVSCLVHLCSYRTYHPRYIVLSLSLCPFFFFFFFQRKGIELISDSSTIAPPTLHSSFSFSPSPRPSFLFSTFQPPFSLSFLPILVLAFFSHLPCSFMFPLFRLLDPFFCRLGHGEGGRGWMGILKAKCTRGSFCGIPAHAPLSRYGMDVIFDVGVIATSFFLLLLFFFPFFIISQVCPASSFPHPPPPPSFSSPF